MDIERGIKDLKAGINQRGNNGSINISLITAKDCVVAMEALRLRPKAIIKIIKGNIRNEIANIIFNMRQSIDMNEADSTADRILALLAPPKPDEPQGRKCPFCKGVGRYYDTKQECPTCLGSGQATKEDKGC